MFKPRSYVLFLLAPIVVLLPFSLAFLARVTALGSGDVSLIALGGAIGYGIGAAVYTIFVLRVARPVADALAQGADPSTAMSECLVRTSGYSAGLWIVWGVVLAAIGAVARMPTLIGFQYFVEASLLVAAPAMAWAYWGGKAQLLRHAKEARALRYEGRVYSFSVKIALVFIGFFIVAVGALVQLIASHVANRLRDPAVASDTIVREILIFGIAVAVATAAVFALATYLLARDVATPMRELIRIAADMAEGRFDTHPHLFSDDEAGSVVERFIVTHDNIRTLITRMGNSGSTIAGGVRLMSDGTAALVRSAGEQKDLASSSSTALANVRNEAESVVKAGDKMAALTFDSAGRATELLASSAEVARRMDELFHSVEKTSSSTTEISASTGQMTLRTNDLSGFTNEVLTFVAEMDATIEQIHHTSQDTAKLSDEVRENAAEGRRAVEATVDGIRSAQESTRRTAGAFESLQQGLRQIDQITLMIEEITNQTNLLSFNAAIIAAQAGQNDFGFSVIADEIRQLADRTRGATKEIAAIIRGVAPVAGEAMRAINEGVTRVDDTVDLAQKAEISLSSILVSAGRSLDMSRSISQALEEQTGATRHLHDVMGKVSESVAEIHRTTAGQAEATRLLADEGERVRDIALQVKRATDEQTTSSEGIAHAMEQIAQDVSQIRGRLDSQLRQTEEIAQASSLTLRIAGQNSAIAEQFSNALAGLLASGGAFEREVAKFRV